MYKHASRFQQHMREAESRRAERFGPPVNVKKRKLTKRQLKRLCSRKAVKLKVVKTAETTTAGQVPLDRLAYAIRRGTVKLARGLPLGKRHS
jgi:hypothetical protein